MAIQIALFNHKGGVSKTTTAFHLGWMLAEKGKRVILVDTDPQCNLTGLVMGFTNSDDLEKFYTNEPNRNLRGGLSPVFEARPEPIKAVDCIEVPNRPGLFLLPGHIRIAEYEVTLGIAQELGSSLQPLQNLPGSFSALFNATAEHHKADYIIVDMSPSLGSINQNLLMTSDYFIVPTAPDFFSVMAINSLANVLPRWNSWATQASNMPTFRDATYPFPKTEAKFLGYIVQNYTQRKDLPSNAFQHWITEIEKAVNSILIPAFEKGKMLLSNETYQDENLEPQYCLAKVPDFQSLAATSQNNQTPVFALTEKQIGHSGVVLETYVEMQSKFRAIFEKLADSVLGMAI